MNGEDMLINQNLKLNDIAEGLSEILSVKLSEIFVYEESAELTEQTVSDNILILCQVIKVEGYFLQLLKIDGIHSSPAINKYKLANGFCNKYKCECLIDSGSENPFSFILVKGAGNYQTIYLSPEFINEDKYVIDHRF